MPMAMGSEIIVFMSYKDCVAAWKNMRENVNDEGTSVPEEAPIEKFNGGCSAATRSKPRRRTNPSKSPPLTKWVSFVQKAPLFVQKKETTHLLNRSSRCNVSKQSANYFLRSVLQELRVQAVYSKPFGITRPGFDACGTHKQRPKHSKVLK